jgi:hypothetical protein
MTEKLWHIFSSPLEHISINASPELVSISFLSDYQNIGFIHTKICIYVDQTNIKTLLNCNRMTSGGSRFQTIEES